MGAVENIVYGLQKKTAQLIIKKKANDYFGTKIEVQFNPSEYRISRSLNMSSKKAVGGDRNPEKPGVVSDGRATLNVTLHFDGISELYSVLNNQPSLKKAATLGMTAMYNLKKFRTNDVTQQIVQLVMFDPDTHAPRQVEFRWGTLNFGGMVQSCTINNTMFAPDGAPIKMSMDLSIVGEETWVARKRKLPFNSPDRTKERTMGMCDELWMHADTEYSDPSMWRPIADANKILNPRRVMLHKITIPPV